MTINNILVAGVGGVGSLVATLLTELGMEVTGADCTKHQSAPNNIKFVELDVSDNKALDELLETQDAVVSCLPYHLTIKIAKAAYRAGIHHFDPTEDVEITNKIRKMAEDSKGAMVPQCGLAPGAIGIIGSSLTHNFSKLRSIELRVGALPQHPTGLLGYAFNWSPEGVVNEYLNDCEVIRSGDVKMVPAMQNTETVIIDGNIYEAFLTSGGLGTMCETFEGKVMDLNYKSIRYPGHCNLMRFYFHELLMQNDRKKAGEILVQAKPPVNDDVVHIHAAVEGWKGKKLQRDEFVQSYFPMELCGKEWKAIAWTTAVSIVSVVEMVSLGDLPQKGFVKQEEIPFDKFLKTTFGRLYVK